MSRITKRGGERGNPCNVVSRGGTRQQRKNKKGLKCVCAVVKLALKGFKVERWGNPHEIDQTPQKGHFSPELPMLKRTPFSDSCSGRGTLSDILAVSPCVKRSVIFSSSSSLLVAVGSAHLRTPHCRSQLN